MTHGSYYDNNDRPRNIKGWLHLLNCLLERGPVLIIDTRRHPRELCVLNGYAREDNGRLVITDAGRAIVSKRRQEEVEDRARFFTMFPYKSGRR